MIKKMQVLALDDEVNILNSLKRAFRDESFDLYATTSPEEALEVLRREDIKVVISDQKMPKMEGVEFLKCVKEIKSDVVRILFTGHADIQTAENAINQGEVYRFVNKPWNDHDLKEILRDALNHFDLTAENKRLFKLIQSQNRDLELANRQLEQMIEKQIDFTTTISHELRTPLTSIRLAIEVILNQNILSMLDADGARYLNIVRTNIQRLRRLIDDVLDLSKLEAGKGALPLEELDIHEIIREIAILQGPVAEKKGLTLDIKLEAPVSRIKINADKINQLLNNLVSNAIKFTDQGGVVIFSRMNLANCGLQVCVSDTGRGISEEDQAHLFQKFQQFGRPDERTEGTGLGLAICKEIVSKHQGQIAVESVLGKGSAFIFTLPFETGRKL